MLNDPIKLIKSSFCNDENTYFNVPAGAGVPLKSIVSCFCGFNWILYTDCDPAIGLILGLGDLSLVSRTLVHGLKHYETLAKSACTSHSFCHSNNIIKCTYLCVY